VRGVGAGDERAVAETVYRYALGVDSRDWALYRAQFADRVRVDFSSHFGQPIVELDADDWVAAVRPGFERLHATQHLMTNPLADVTGDTARIRMYVQATHVLDPTDPASIFTVGGCYDDELVRRGAQWALTSVRLTVLWHTGDPSIMDAARRPG
jgi:hypothetical protein